MGSLHDLWRTSPHPVACVQRGLSIVFDCTSVPCSFPWSFLVGKHPLGGKSDLSIWNLGLKMNPHCFALWKITSNISLETVAPADPLNQLLLSISHGIFRLFLLDFEFRVLCSIVNLLEVYPLKKWNDILLFQRLLFES